MHPLGRLKRRNEFQAVAAGRRKAVAAGLILQVRRRPPSVAGAADGNAADGSAIRVGFTASRRVGNAVARNRAKRRLRALAGEILPARAAAGCDYVLIARTATVERRYEALRADLLRALERLGVSRPEIEEAGRDR